MAEKEQNPQQFLSQWYQLQQQYLKDLGQMLNPAESTSTSAENPFEAWWQQFPKSGQGDFDALFKQLSSVGMGMMQNPFTAMQQPLKEGFDAQQWFEQMNHQFNDWIKTGAGANPLFEKINEQFKQQMQSPSVATLFPWMQNPFAMPASSNALNSPMLKLLQNLFGDEEKKAGEQLVKTLEQYQMASLQFNHLLAQVGIDSLQQLQQKLESKTDVSLQDMYQWWMDIGQQVFNEEKLSEPFQRLQQQLEKTQKQLKKDFQHYRQTLIEQLGLVARDEYVELKQQVKELQKQVDALKRQTPNESTRNEKESVDDFTKLNGIGAKFNEKLHQQGIKNLQQLASMSDEMLKNLDQDLQTKGKVFQQQWREQAEAMLNAMSGRKK